MNTKIKKVGVIGAGQMGIGISQVCATSGFDVNLVDINDEIVDHAKNKIEESLQKLTTRGKITEDEKTFALGKIKFGTDLSVFKGCQLVIEAVTDETVVRDETPAAEEAPAEEAPAEEAPAEEAPKDESSVDSKEKNHKN